MNKYFDKHSLYRRRLAERIFRAIGLSAVITGFIVLLILFTSIVSNGFSGFYATKILLPVAFDKATLGLADNPSSDDILNANYYLLLKNSVAELLPDFGRDSQTRREVVKLFSALATQDLRDALSDAPELLGQKVDVAIYVNSDIDQLVKGNISLATLQKAFRINDIQAQAFEYLQQQQRIVEVFNWSFFFKGDSRYPERAGIGGAMVGTFYSLLVCFLLSFPIGIAAALYLEEFAPKNRWTELIEININNLAAVPSIVFGLLGLGIILNVFGLPRGTALVGGIVLALMTMPIIIIASRSAIKSVPPSIRQAALAIGASPMQVVLHHVLPLALPGMLTGSIIGLSRALGETAPLLMIGMIAFIADVPQTPVDPSAALPVQIYLWAESAERGFVEKTAAAIMVIFVFLVMMNATAVCLRQKYERRW